MAAFAGLLMGALSGFEIPKIGTWIKGYKVKPLFSKVKLPPIVAMIIMGCIVRNFFGSAVKLGYPDTWAQWIRTCCLAILLVRGGLQVTFSGKGIIVVLLSLVPLGVEAVTQALVALGVFDMPINLAFNQGFAIATVAPSIVVPQMMYWNDQGYGRSKGIAGTLIAACTFDNITCLIIFNVVNTVTMDMIGKARGIS